MSKLSTSLTFRALALFLGGMAISGAAWADAISDCQQALMSRPICANRIEATRWCAQFRGGAEFVEMARQCVNEHRPASMPARRDAVTAMCLMGMRIESANPAEMESLCN